jgi:transcriptional regulator with XRE-family HTH domain
MKSTPYIGRNIRNYRNLQDLNQQQLADYIGVTRELISLIESGKRDISLENLTKLADLFGIELSDLLEEDNEVQDVNLALAYRANDSIIDLESIASFKRIVLNYKKLEGLKHET